jgi:hypothetical protein
LVVFRMSASGSASSTTRSAFCPARSSPTSPAARQTRLGVSVTGVQEPARQVEPRGARWDGDLDFARSPQGHHPLAPDDHRHLGLRRGSGRVDHRDMGQRDVGASSFVRGGCGRRVIPETAKECDCSRRRAAGEKRVGSMWTACPRILATT